MYLSDPFGNGLAGTNTNIMAFSGARMNNAIKYATPNFAGFNGDVAYSFGETAGNTSANSAYGGSLGYSKGPLAIRLGYHNKNTNNLATGVIPTRNTDAKNTILAATYDFAVVKAYFGYGVNKGLDSSPYLVANPYGAAVAPTSSTDSRDMLVGVSVPYGAHTFLATYIRKDDRDAANRDTDLIGVGYLYALSKRTNLYAAYARINNKNGAAYTVGSAIEGGSGNKGLNLGIRHVF